MQRNAIWTLAAAATVAGALATLPSAPNAIGAAINATDNPGYRCYPASAAKGATGDLPVISIGEDEFGFFNVTLTKVKLYCTPTSLPGINTLRPPVVCFATKDLAQPSIPSGGIKINVTVDQVGQLGLKLKKSKLTCLPVTSFK